MSFIELIKTGVELKAIVKVDGKGRITIPLFIREAVGLEPNSYVEIEFDEVSKELKVRPVSKAGELLVDVLVELTAVNGIHTLIDSIVKEGADIKLLRCKSIEEGKYACALTVGVLDYELFRTLKESLKSMSLKVREVAIRR